MSKAYAWMWVAGAMMFAGCDDGPVGKAINCRQICEKVNDCVPGVDESKCRSDCKDDGDKSDVTTCSDCLDGDSCIECTADCAAVGVDVLLK